MTVTTKLLTAEELLELPDDSQRYELIAGELHATPLAGDEQGGIAAAITTSLGSYARAHRLGFARAGGTGFVLSRGPDTVRAAAVSFVSRACIEAEGREVGYRHGAPDLAVEFISPRDRYTDVEEKVAEWFDGGARMVVVINPRRRSVTVYSSLIKARILRVADVLDGQDVVPGWQMPLAAMFED